jgi:hypothetical protein
MAPWPAQGSVPLDGWQPKGAVADRRDLDAPSPLPTRALEVELLMAGQASEGMGSLLLLLGWF